MNKITATELRSNIYNIIDRVLETGEPCEIMRGDKRVYITPVLAQSAPVKKSRKPKTNEGLMTRLAKLPKRQAWLGTDEELVNLSAWDEAAWERKWDERLKDD